MGVILKGPFRKRLDPQSTSFAWFAIPLLGIVILSLLITGYIGLKTAPNPQEYSKRFTKEEALSRCYTAGYNILSIGLEEYKIVKIKRIYRFIVEYKCKEQYEQVR